MKNLVIILVVALIGVGAFFALRKTVDTTPIESDYLDFLLGSDYKAEKNNFDKTTNFEANKDKIYFIIATKKKLDADTPFNVVVKSVDTAETISTLTINSNDKEIKKSINPVNVTKAGKYVVEVLKGESAVVRKVIDVIEAVPGSAAPATGEVKVEAPAAPATGEVQPK